MSRNRQPSTWEEYERGGHRGSVGSTESRVRFDDSQGESSTARSQGDGSHDRHNSNLNLRSRRSSLSMRINSLRQAGGVNSIDNFARSIQRATNFWEIESPSTQYRYSGVDGDSHHYSREDIEAQPGSQRSLLRAALEEEGSRVSVNVFHEDERETIDPMPTEERRRESLEDDIFAVQPQLAAPLAGNSFGPSYGTLESRIAQPAQRHAGRLFKNQQAHGDSVDKERELLLVRPIQGPDGKVVEVVVGQSTLPQTIFNSVNVLIGVGLLSIPLAMKYSGWVIGMTFLLFAAITTRYTARLLAKCLSANDRYSSFSDLAHASFGPRAKLPVDILFSLELLGACVALVVLFADNLDALIPGYGILGWKLLCGVVLIPLGFLPLRLLSISSILGIVSTFTVVVVVIVDGLIKPDTPGSLREPAQTGLFPSHWGTLPLSFGLLMSPWGGHSVFPNIFRDMRHPRKYTRSLNITFSFTYLLDVSMAIAGFLMFGEGVRDEITANILLNKGYPEVLSWLIAICIAIIPLTKIPLNAGPIVSRLEVALGIDHHSLAASTGLVGMSGLNRGILKVSVRIATTVIIVLVAILIPSFDRIMGLIGSVACSSICIILPLAFHLIMFGKEIHRREKILNWVLIVSCSTMAIISTVFGFIPKRLIGAE